MLKTCILVTQIVNKRMEASHGYSLSRPKRNSIRILHKYQLDEQPNKR